MFKIKSATRLAILVGLICASLVWLSLGLGLIPDPHKAEIRRRIAVTKAIAVTVSAYTESGRFLELRRLLENNVKIEFDLKSVGLRRESTGNHVLVVGPHRELWNSGETEGAAQVSIDILSNGKKWGQLELIFSAQKTAWFGFPIGVVAFLACGVTLATWTVLHKSFKYLNPANVVPTRVRSALDSLAGGLVLLTAEGEIAHANRSFARTVGLLPDSILGKKLNDFNWSIGDEGKLDFPWMRCQSLQETVSGEIIEANIPGFIKRKFMVNATPILGSQQEMRGVLVSFEDVTALEQKKAELANIIQTVRLSRDEVERQNEKLNFLASHDPLTKCMNRRAFFGRFEKIWGEVEDNQLTLVMLDIDHFKSINDNHGHSTGDEVLIGISEILRDSVGNRGLVCRYGGEEFVLLFKGIPFDECFGLAEQLRQTIEQTAIAKLQITASLGISNMGFGPMDPQHMLDQADQCLYAAKRNGRNQVVRFDEYNLYEQPPVANDQTEALAAPQQKASEIEHSAVTGLLSALAFRSPATAQHSIRVADLAVAIGRKMMNSRDLYRLEVAALLHDIGKIGVPDSILNKPGRLTPDEWEIMRRHDDMGVAIVRNAFASEEVAQTIERHCNSGKFGFRKDETEPKTKTISCGILDVCDAFDSLVNDQVYRKAVFVDQALEEIRRNTPSQFNANIVDQLINYVESGCYQSRRKVEQPHVAAIESEQQVDELYEAIASEDLSKVREIVGALKCKQLSSESKQHQSLAKPTVETGTEMEALLEIAHAAIDLCQTSRFPFVDGEKLALVDEVVGSE